MRLSWALCVIIAGTYGTELAAQPPQTQDPLQRSTARATGDQSYQLRYKARAGEAIRWEVEQIASTETRMAGHEENSSLRSRSVHSWIVDSVDSHDQITFRNQLESASEWQKVGDTDPVSFDSVKGGDVADIFQPTAEKIGKPIATITIDPYGVVVNRVDHIKTTELGMGAVTIPFPEQPIPIDFRWETPEEVMARRKDKSLKPIKTRIVYTLRSVKEGIATISFRREVLTPVDDPWIEMQLQQKINQGSILFDIGRGRVTKKTVQWDEQVQGFEGSDSFLRYLGSYTMTLLSDDSPAQAPGSTSRASGSSPPTGSPLQPLPPVPPERSSSYVKPRDGAPIIRR